MMDQQIQAAQPQIKSNPYASPMHQYGASIILLTNPENELYRLELTLRNAIADEEGKLQQYGDPLLNDEGIVAVLGMTQTILNQVTIMSNFSKYEIPQLMQFLNDTVARDLMMNRKRYDINDGSARDKIHFSVLTYAFIAMKRAFEQGEKKFWKGSQQDIRTEVVGANSQKRGWLQTAMGWK